MVDFYMILLPYEQAATTICFLTVAYIVEILRKANDTTTPIPSVSCISQTLTTFIFFLVMLGWSIINNKPKVRQAVVKAQREKEPTPLLPFGNNVS